MKLLHRELPKSLLYATSAKKQKQKTKKQKKQKKKQPHQIQFINRGLKVFVTVSNSAAWSEINLFLRNSYWIKTLHSRDCRFSIISQLKAFERGTRNLILFSDQFRIRLFFKWDSRHTKLSNHYKLFFTRKRCLFNLDLKPFIW